MKIIRLGWYKSRDCRVMAGYYLGKSLEDLAEHFQLGTGTVIDILKLYGNLPGRWHYAKSCY